MKRDIALGALVALAVLGWVLCIAFAAGAAAYKDEPCAEVPYRTGARPVCLIVRQL